MTYKTTINTIIKSSSILLSGTIISSIIGIIVISILTKNLSLEEYGFIVIIQAYILLINQLFNFQSWQVLIKYIKKLEPNVKETIEKLQIGIFLDVIGSILSFALSFILILPLAKIMNFNTDLLYEYLFFSVVLLSSIIGTPTAVLRLENKYKYFNYVLLITWGLKLILILIVQSFYTLNIFNILMIFLISEVLGNIILVLLSLKILKQNGISLQKIIPNKNIFSIMNKNRRFLKFAIRTNLNSATLGTTRVIDELIVAAVLSPAYAAVFKIIKLLSSTIGKVLDPLYVTFYPEINKYVISKDYNSIYNIIKKISMISGLISLIIYIFFFLFGDKLITIIFTDSYLIGLESLYIYLIGLLISFTFFYTQPLMLAFELEDYALYINIFSSFVYLTLLYFFTINFQLNGIACSFIIFWFMVTFLKIYFLNKKTKLFKGN